MIAMRIRTSESFKAFTINVEGSLLAYWLDCLLFCLDRVRDFLIHFD